MGLGDALFGKGAKKPIKSISSKDYREEVYNNQTEEWHQKQIIMYLDRKGIYYEISLSGIFLPNTNKVGSPAWKRQDLANKKVIMKLKQSGWNNGVADIKVYLPKIELNIELKSMKGKASKDQLSTQKKFKKFKYAEYHVVQGSNNAINLIESKLWYNLTVHCKISLLSSFYFPQE